MSDELFGHSDLVESIIFDNPKKGLQYRFSISEFREQYYISIREWIIGFEGEWMPTRNGMTFPYNMHTSYGLFRAFVDVLSQAEVLQELTEKLESERENRSTDETS